MKTCFFRNFHFFSTKKSSEIFSLSYEIMFFQKFSSEIFIDLNWFFQHKKFHQKTSALKTCFFKNFHQNFSIFWTKNFIRNFHRQLWKHVFGVSMSPNKDNFYIKLICIFQSQIEKLFMVLNWVNSVYRVYFWANRSVPEFRTLLNRICQSLSSRKYLNIEIDQINQLKRSTFDSLSALNIQIASCF